MLIDFEVENFRSYREAKSFSFVSSAIKEFPQNLIELPGLDLRLLKTAAIYGPNGSGKSNLLSAMHCLAELLGSPIQRSAYDNFSPFVLDRTSNAKPTRFAIRFMVDEILFQYRIAARLDLIVEEHLTAYPRGRSQEWFSRLGNKIDFKSPHLKGQKRSLTSVTPAGTPFLAVASAFDHPQLSVPARWLMSNLANRFELPTSRGLLLSFGDTWLEGMTASQCHGDAEFRLWADAFLRHADIGIQRLEIKVVERKARRVVSAHGAEAKPPVPMTKEVTEEEYHPYFVHSGEDGLTVEFPVWNESQGTRRLFTMLSPIYQALKHGHLAVVDELSASLHPMMVRELIRVFHQPASNPKNAQLLFATHDSSLLNGRLFRRDQIWFTEKSPAGATDLYSLHDLKSVRNEEAFEDGYLRGRYGAIPFFGPFNFPPIQSESYAGEDESGTGGGAATSTAIEK